MNPIEKLHSLGQSIWYDNIERRLLNNGELAAMIERGDIRGVTSNPSIFNNAIANSNDYDDALIPLAKDGLSKEGIYESLAVADIQAACDLFLPLYKESKRGDGYVSLEVSPYLAHDTDGTCKDAVRLWEWVDRPNLMIKIPATKEGLPAITQSIAAGINVNVTLIFSVERYEEVMDAYLVGLEQRLEAGKHLDHVASVASFFVSRIDSNVDKRIDEILASPMHNAHYVEIHKGKVAIANAKVAYARHKEVFSGDRWTQLKESGAQIQRALWASTSTKNPEYPDTLYVDQLIGPNTVNTIPPKTLAAFAEHGTAEMNLEKDVKDADTLFVELESVGITMAEVTQELEDSGVKSFADAFTNLLESVENRRKVATL
ncbi:MAG: transaldolase [Anaerolineales bacterium]|nr:transaldolase [Chloroflexota bacterium]MBL6981162.1 transaldolase [Anaerolineales bacterium]